MCPGAANGIELVRGLPGNAAAAGRNGHRQHLGGLAAAGAPVRTCHRQNARARAPGWTPQALSASARRAAAGAGRQRRRHHAARRPGRAGRLRGGHHGRRRAAGRARAARDPGGRLHHQRRRAVASRLQPGMCCNAACSPTARASAATSSCSGKCRPSRFAGPGPAPGRRLRRRGWPWAWPLPSACAILREMASFEAAGVSEQTQR